MLGIGDLFQWERFVTPTVIKVFYWLAVVISLLLGIVGVVTSLNTMAFNPFVGMIFLIATVLGTLNSALHEQYLQDDRSFCTVIFGLLRPDGDGDGFTVTLARGGHAAPLLMRADGTADYLPMPLGPLIGAWADVVFTTTTIRLNPADTLLLFTDGLTEARAPATEARAPTTDPSGRYGDEALRAFARELAPSTAAAAVTAIISLLDSLGEGRQDDTAVLALGARTADNPMPSA